MRIQEDLLPKAATVRWVAAHRSHLWLTAFGCGGILCFDFALELASDVVDQVRQHVVGVALEGVGDVLLRNAVPLGQALEHLAQLGLRLAHVDVQLLKPSPS